MVPLPARRPRAPRGGRTIVLGVALMLAAQSLHNWRGAPAAEQPPAPAAKTQDTPPATDAPPREHEPK